MRYILTTDRRPPQRPLISKIKFQMAISLQLVIRSTSCLVLMWGFRGRRIEWRYFRFEQIQDGGRRHLKEISKISSGHISATGRPIHFLFCFKIYTFYAVVSSVAWLRVTLTRLSAVSQVSVMVAVGTSQLPAANDIVRPIYFAFGDNIISRRWWCTGDRTLWQQWASTSSAEPYSVSTSTISER